jgi:hypothetical protein
VSFEKGEPPPLALSVLLFEEVAPRVHHHRAVSAVTAQSSSQVDYLWMFVHRKRYYGSGGLGFHHLQLLPAAVAGTDQ